MNNIYVEGELPKCCAEHECPFNYDTCRCRAKEFIDVGDKNIEYVYEDGRHKTCPLKLLSTRLVEERKKVVQEIREKADSFKYTPMYDEYGGITGTFNRLDYNKLNAVLDQIEGASDERTNK